MLTGAEREALSTRQREVLDLVVSRFEGSMAATVENYRIVARAMLINHYRTIFFTLMDLRHKGYVRSEGSSLTRPTRWVVVTVEAGVPHVEA